VNVHLDLRTLSGARDVDDLDDLVLRGEGWTVTKHAAERLLCDSALVATLFAGRNRVLDANDAAEQFTRRQRRALAARDGHCVFPSCARPPRFCDAHHLHQRAHDGPTRTDNAALLRLSHECRLSRSRFATRGTMRDGRERPCWGSRAAVFDAAIGVGLAA
jgi:hypothetical protein